MGQKPPLDRIDRAIIVALQNDARLSNKELAARVGLAPSSCLQRVRRLREGGVLLGFTARIDPQAIGIGLQAMVALEIRDHQPSAQGALMARLRELKEVVAIYETGGRTDLLVQVAVRDSVHLRELVHATITAEPNVGQVETMILFDYEWRSLPLYE